MNELKKNIISWFTINMTGYAFMVLALTAGIPFLVNILFFLIAIYLIGIMIVAYVYHTVPEFKAQMRKAMHVDYLRFLKKAEIPFDLSYMIVLAGFGFWGCVFFYGVACFFQYTYLADMMAAKGLI